MAKIIAILVLMTELSVSVEKENGFVTQTFPNSVSGARQLIDFAEATVGEPEEGVIVVVGWLSEAVSTDLIIDELSKDGIRTALLGPAELTSYRSAKETEVGSESATVVANAYKEKLSSLLRKRKN